MRHRDYTRSFYAQSIPNVPRVRHKSVQPCGTTPESVKIENLTKFCEFSGFHLGLSFGFEVGFWGILRIFDGFGRFRRSVGAAPGLYAVILLLKHPQSAQSPSQVRTALRDNSRERENRNFDEFSMISYISIVS